MEIRLGGRNFTIATDRNGNPRVSVTSRTTQPADGGAIQYAVWRTDGHDLNSFEVIPPGASGGYLGRDYGVNTDGRWLGVDTLGPLVNVIDLSVFDSPLGVGFLDSTLLGEADPTPPASAWTVIGSTTLASPASSISFASIDPKYKMFRVTAYIVKDGTAGTVGMRLNNDSGTNYDRQHLIGNSTTVSASRGTGQDRMYLATNTLAASSVATFSITIGKQIAGSAAMALADSVLFAAPGISALLEERAAFRWSNTADLISRIDLISSSGNFAAGTVVVLEGVPD